MKLSITTLSLFGTLFIGNAQAQNFRTQAPECPSGDTIVATVVTTVNQIVSKKECAELITAFTPVFQECKKDQGMKCFQEMLKLSERSEEIKDQVRQCIPSIRPELCSPNTPFQNLADDFEECGDKTIVQYISDTTICSSIKDEGYKTMCENTRKAAAVFCTLYGCDTPVASIGSAMHQMCSIN
eukprot:CAMPEP_0203779816 /NCGR_PEP_ID=MMETSP0099_2-20121227/8951_1 /ASSEMBLY_ACC=CAM_ASM_000209 /TAXON_ID=96639 /ORGANISM=" , Strain NY0313808BC1" /LENGTH=183 /DNA_ID=CAMNT_0050679855 /DNA_START=335 /DNA_END=886 /DNA_ORIENTATION=+